MAKSTNKENREYIVHSQMDYGSYVEGPLSTLKEAKQYITDMVNNDYEDPENYVIYKLVPVLYPKKTKIEWEEVDE